MENIIGKLGIKRLCCFSRGDKEWIFSQDEVREIETQRNEMLEELISKCLKIESYYKSKCTPNQLLDFIYKDSLKIIEKDACMSWKEIKKLVENT